MRYTPEEEKELNKELREYQAKFKRLIQSQKWDAIASDIYDVHMSTVTKIMNAKSYKDVSWIVWNNADYALEHIRYMFKQVKLG